MRYILINPYDRTVTEADDPRLDDREDHLDTLYEIMGCAPLDWNDMRIRPKHDLIVDDNAAFKKPPLPGFFIGNMLVVGTAMILGLRGRYAVSASLKLERVQQAVNFDVGDARPKPPEVKSFTTPEEMQAFMASQPKARFL